MTRHSRQERRPPAAPAGARESAPTCKWVAETSARAENTMSVCNGAFILAPAGLLDGLTATTTCGLIDQLRTEFPKVKVVDDRRFVDNGRIITAAGLSSGIDGALHLVSRLFGHGTAQQVALGEEYDWRPEAGFARAALADRLIPGVDLDGIGHWETVSTQGGTDHWELILQGTSDLGAAGVLDRISGEIKNKANWTSVPDPGAGSAPGSSSEWKFSGRDGRPWSGTLSVQDDPGNARKYTVKLAIARVG